MDPARSKHAKSNAPKYKSDIVEDITQALENWKIAPRFLCLELTESAIMTDPAHAMEILTQLHNKGVMLQDHKPRKLRRLWKLPKFKSAQMLYSPTL